jgi:hypothetical protein
MPGVVLRLATPPPVVLDVPLIDEVLFGGFAQLEVGVFAHGVVQPVTGDIPHVNSRHQRLIDKR